VYADAAVLPVAIRAIAADGVRCVVAGVEEEYDTYPVHRVVRLGADGAPDASFGTSGVVRIDDSDVWFGEVTGVGVDAEGRVVLGGNHDGFSFEDDYDAIVVRLTPAGALDTTFGGGDGAIVFDVLRSGYEWDTRLRLAPGGTGPYVITGNLYTSTGGAAGWWLAEVPQSGGAPRILRQRISDRVAITRSYGLAFARDGAALLGMTWEGESPASGEDNADDLYLARVKLTPSGPADLSAAWRKQPAQRCAGEGTPCTVKGSLVVANGGAQPATATTVRLYASDDAVLDGGDPLVGEIAVPALKPGAARTVPVKVRPAESLAGRRLIAVVDAGGAVAEKDETNQEAASGVVP
jgi:hypothetical protein